jgi:hypothetical protein
VTNVGPDTSPEQDVRGFNLIGNPYPSAIDWKSTGWTRNNLLVTGSGYDMWIWNPAAKNYGVYNTATVGSTGTHGVTQNIAPMQGFYVRAASNGSVGMTNTIRVNTGASNWMKTKNNKTNNLKVRIACDSSLGYDEVLVQFGASLNEAGAAKLFSTIKSAPSLYLTHGKEELTVLNLTDTFENTSVPLMFKAGSDGNYTLTINLESKDYEVLLLEDKKTKTISDLKVNPKYQFKGLIKDATSRFVLHFAPINKEIASLPAVIYYDGNEIIVDLTLISEQTEVKIYDMLGKLLVDKKVEGKMIHRFDINPKNEVYIVVGNSKGKSISRKILAY